jgi:hypothetical protein
MCSLWCVSQQGHGIVTFLLSPARPLLAGCRYAMRRAEATLISCQVIWRAFVPRYPVKWEHELLGNWFFLYDVEQPHVRNDRCELKSFRTKSLQAHACMGCPTSCREPVTWPSSWRRPNKKRTKQEFRINWSGSHPASLEGTTGGSKLHVRWDGSCLNHPASLSAPTPEGIHQMSQGL